MLTLLSMYIAHISCSNRTCTCSLVWERSVWFGQFRYYCTFDSKYSAAVLLNEYVIKCVTFAKTKWGTILYISNPYTEGTFAIMVRPQFIVLHTAVWASDNNLSVLFVQTDAGKWMRLMRKHVIPRISAEWDSVSYSLEYSAQATKQFRKLYQLVSVIVVLCCTYNLCVNHDH